MLVRPFRRTNRASNGPPACWVIGAALAAALSLPLPARACPDCPDGIRKQVRAGIFDEGFARNAGMAALPFGVLAGVSAMIHFGLLGRRVRRG